MAEGDEPPPGDAHRGGTIDSHTSSRRTFLGALPALLVVLAQPRWPLRLRLQPPAHPDPRPGIDASKVLPRERLADHPDVAKIFDMVREMPQIVDGIRCHCGCTDGHDFRSLLSCYEGEAMAQDCHICQGQARLAYSLFKKGASLNDIRAAIDKEF